MQHQKSCREDARLKAIRGSRRLVGQLALNGHYRSRTVGQEPTHYGSHAENVWLSNRLVIHVGRIDVIHTETHYVPYICPRLARSPINFSGLLTKLCYYKS